MYTIDIEVPDALPEVRPWDAEWPTLGIFRRYYAGRDSILDRASLRPLVLDIVYASESPYGDYDVVVAYEGGDRYGTCTGTVDSGDGIETCQARHVYVVGSFTLHVTQSRRPMRQRERDTANLHVWSKDHTEVTRFVARQSDATRVADKVIAELLLAFLEGQGPMVIGPHGDTVGLDPGVDPLA